MIHALAETTSEAYWDNYWFIHDCSITNKENQIDWWWRNWFSLALQCMPTHLCNFIKVLLVWCCSKLPIHVTGMSNYYHYHLYYWHFYHYHYMYDQYHLGIARLRHIQCGYREGQNKPALKLKHNHNEMVTSSNGNIFRVTGPLWRESNGHRWIPLTKASDTGLWYFLWSAPEQTLEQKIDTPVIWDAIELIMTPL